MTFFGPCIGTPLAAVGLLMAATALGACEQTATAIREAPGKDSPFAAYGYRNLKPEPVPNTEIPNEKLARYSSCVSGREEQIASQWVRDWFAASSSLDRCDDWALGVLSSPEMRSNLIFILERSQKNVESGSACQAAAFDVFTSIEETHSLLASWRNGVTAVCDRRRLKEVTDKRAREFTDRIAAVTEGLERYKNQ